MGARPAPEPGPRTNPARFIPFFSATDCMSRDRGPGTGTEIRQGPAPEAIGNMGCTEAGRAARNQHIYREIANGCATPLLVAQNLPRAWSPSALTEQS